MPRGLEAGRHSGLPIEAQEASPQCLNAKLGLAGGLVNLDKNFLPTLCPKDQAGTIPARERGTSMWIEVCEIAKPLGHSWPSIHWWLSLTAADQGAWISGLGSLAAVIVALGIAINQARTAKAIQVTAQGTRALMLAVEGTAYLPMLHSDVNMARTVVDNMEAPLTVAGYEKTMRLVRLPSGEMLPKMSEYEGAPRHVATAFAALSSMVAAHNLHVDLVAALSGPWTAAELKEYLGTDSINRVHEQLIELTDLLKDYQGFYSRLDFRQRRDYMAPLENDPDKNKKAAD